MTKALPSPSLNSLLLIATFIFGVLLNFVIKMLRFARAQFLTLVSRGVVSSRRKVVNVVHIALEKPASLVSNHFGWAFGLLLPVAALPSKSHEDNWKTILKEADKLYNDHSYKKLKDLLIQYKDHGNAEVLWRLARATYEVAKLASAPTEQKELDYEAYGYIKQALAIDPNNFAVHKWMFILLDKKSSYEGIKERISQSYNVKKHIEQACELNPKDGTSLHLLGYWCFSVAELPWFQRKIASTLFASPPVSSYEEALQYFLQAEEVEPNFYSKNLLMIGKTYLRLKDKEKAAAYLTRARDYPAGSAEDVEAREEATNLLKSL